MSKRNPVPEVWRSRAGGLRWGHLAGGHRGHFCLALGRCGGDVIIPKRVLSAADCGDHAVTELEGRQNRQERVESGWNCDKGRGLCCERYGAATILILGGGCF